MSESFPVFVSHSHEDVEWCRGFVGLLRSYGADVWYDEHNLGYGELMDEIGRQLAVRPVFVVILSPHAISSKWVKMEMTGAVNLWQKHPDRIILPVVAHQCEIPVLWTTFKYVSGPSDSGISPQEAAIRVAHALGLEMKTSQPEAEIAKTLQIGLGPASVRHEQLDSQSDLPLATYDRLVSVPSGDHPGQTVTQIRATDNSTLSPLAEWLQKGSYYVESKVYEEALTAYECALAIDRNNSLAWSGKAIALKQLGRYEEAGFAARCAQLGAVLARRQSDAS